MLQLLASLAAAALVSGLLALATGIVGTRRPARPPSRFGQAIRRVWLGDGLSAKQRQRRQATQWAAAAAAVAVWFYTGIPIAALIAAVAVIGVPWLFTAGREEQRAIDRLVAVEVWTRRLHDLVGTGVGLTQAIIRSTRDAPPALADELSDLAANLRAGVPTSDALDRLGAQLADASADEVLVRLKLHSTDRGPRLTDVLQRISAGIAQEVEMRREIWADRADPRLTTKFMTVLSVATLVLLFSNRTYMAPFATVLGQLVLLLSITVFIGLLVWIRRLSQPTRVPRLLAPADGGAP
ncbi:MULTISPECIES: type II secretion system F family protein [Asanoa]|uniref:Flp pilus assembly protein TadB n=2 Tax=Asanoa TaxID=195964 RepID=A0A239PFB0_9ACTN|nr:MULTISPECIES: type II secretion system F family protein [Asanoa]SNT65711.1 Flp pilus assembly protein TadB [Asanoa hainanensis]